VCSCCVRDCRGRERERRRETAIRLHTVASREDRPTSSFISSDTLVQSLALRCLAGHLRQYMRVLIHRIISICCFGGCFVLASTREIAIEVHSALRRRGPRSLVGGQDRDRDGMGGRGIIFNSISESYMKTDGRREGEKR
jgi:hypothetical protein